MPTVSLARVPWARKAYRKLHMFIELPRLRRIDFVDRTVVYFQRHKPKVARLDPQSTCMLIGSALKCIK